jgi:hypothetical protein
MVVDMPSNQSTPAQEGEALLWAVIERVHSVAKGNLEASIEAFRTELEALDDERLLAVEAAFAAAMTRAYDYRLWGAAYVIHGGCGDDAFWDFRAGLVALGREVFEAALRDPDSLAEIKDIEDRTLFEGFQYVPHKIVEKRGLSTVGGGHTSEKPTGPEGETDEDHKRRFPRLCSRFDWLA